MQHHFTNILFDLDGTLTDSKEGIFNSAVYALNQFGINVEDKEPLNAILGPPLKNSFMKLYGFDEEKAIEAVEKYREYFSQKGIFENRPYEGIKMLLKHLNDRNKIVILATSKPTVYANRILEKYDLISYFAFVYGSELDGTRANKEDVIEYALEQSNIQNLSETVMVGDRNYDIIGAKQAKIASIGVLYGYAQDDELKEAQADYLVNSVSELESLLI